ncbi:uncharacterized protein LOC132744087 isoform X2 [Ruditapes philippinarum]|uniref:uncharacterized protein LOC132744087 isoform X2 n=1 Tax=Ruditapes philippinarum TaxID=129788 RepID=UPI00295AF21E|nr:uncharacterized protein LOC132744087 isoform X2 [Ruditapes philippinarum]
MSIFTLQEMLVVIRKMFPTIILLVLTVSPALVRARLVNNELSTEDSLDIDASSLDTLDISNDISTDSEMSREELLDTVTSLKASLNKLEAKVGAIEVLQTSNTLNHSVSHGRSVAFHAANIHGIAQLGVNQKIIFETVLLNLGNGYNNHHGIFTAPSAGLYMFSSSMLSANGASNALFAADIIVNGQLYARLYGKGLHGYHAQGSNTIIANLRSGNTVAVRLACCAGSGMYGGYYTTFSGVLLNSCVSPY